MYDAGTSAPFVDYQHCAWTPEVQEHVTFPSRSFRASPGRAILRAGSQPRARGHGLAEDPIITGTADAAAEAISAGLADMGDMMVMYGSSIFFILRTPRFNVTPSFWAAHFLEKGTYVLTGGMSTSGSLTR